MTDYRLPQSYSSAISFAAREAKAKRQAILQRVRAQRAARCKRTVAEWIQEGVIIRGSQLKERYQQKRLSLCISSKSSRTTK